MRNVEDFSPYLCRVAQQHNIPAWWLPSIATPGCVRRQLCLSADRTASGSAGIVAFISLRKKYLSRYVDAVVGVSQFMIDRHKYYGYFPRAKPSVIYTSASPQPLRLPMPQNGYVTFGYIGRIHPTKGVDQIIQAFQKLPPPHHLLIAGDGPEKRTLLTVSFAGRRQPADHFPGK